MYFIAGRDRESADAVRPVLGAFVFQGLCKTVLTLRLSIISIHIRIISMICSRLDCLRFTRYYN